MKMNFIVSVALVAGLSAASSAQCVPDFATPETVIGVPMITPAAGDLNGDGLPDLFAPTEPEGCFRVYMNLGGGFSQTDVVCSGGKGSAVLVDIADVDNDQVLELIAVVSDTDLLSIVFWEVSADGVLLSESPFEFSGPNTPGAEGESVLMDCDGDGDLDVVVYQRSGTSGGASALRTFLFDAGGYHAGPSQPLAYSGLPQHISALARYDGPGGAAPDLVGSLAGGSVGAFEFVYFEGLKNGVFASPELIGFEDSGPPLAAVADWIPGGFKEVLSPRLGEVYKPMLGVEDEVLGVLGEIGPRELTFGGPMLSYVKDLTLDGIPDIVDGNGNLWVGTGTLNFEISLLLPWDVGGVTLIFDLDNDGDMDVLAGSDLYVNSCVTQLDPGACCLPQGGCVVTSLEDCFAVGGSWAGPSTTCEDVICPERCVGDVNFDGAVDFFDLVTLLAAWGNCL